MNFALTLKGDIRIGGSGFSLLRIWVSRKGKLLIFYLFFTTFIALCFYIIFFIWVMFEEIRLVI